MANDEHDQSEGAEQSSSKVSRRSVLQLLGVAFASCALAELQGCAGPEGGEGGDVGEPDLEDGELTISSRVEVVRARDLLALTIGLSNLRRTSAGMLTRVAAGDSYLVLDFPPQAILEEALAHAPQDPPVSKRLPGIADTRMSGPSRLAFLLPASFVSAPYTLDALLSLCSQSVLKLPGVSASTLRLAARNAVPTAPETFGLHPFAAAAIDRATASIDPSASHRLAQRAHLIGDAPAPTPMIVSALNSPAHPYTNEVTTFVEMPFRMLLSPTGGAAFSHTTTLPTDSKEPVELWHTKLCARDPLTGLPDARSAAPSGAGILHVRDNDMGIAGDPLGPPSVKPVSVTSSERITLASQAPYSQDLATIELRKMMLSALGGSLDLHAEFPGKALTAWTHKMAWGREYFVEITKNGFLLPFGHRAIKLQITKRNDDPRMGPVGTLFRWDVVIVKNQLVRYADPDAPGVVDFRRRQDFPFAAVELKRSTFTIPGASGDAFWVSNLGELGPFPVVAYDQGGNAVRFDVPLYFFVSTDGSIAKNYVSTANNEKLKDAIPMLNQRLKYAPSGLDDTCWETKSMLLRLDALSTPAGLFSAAPYLSDVELNVESVRRLTGQPTRHYVFHSKFKAAGLKDSGNRSQLILALPGGEVQQLEFKTSPDSSTGFVRPNMVFNAVSRTNGPMYDVGSSPSVFRSGEDEFQAFDPKKYFDSTVNPAAKALAETLLFGSVKMVDVLKAVFPGDLTDELIKDPLRFAPKFISEAFNEVERFVGAFTNLEEKVGTLHKEAKGQLKKIEDELKAIPAELKARIDAEVKAIKADLESIRDKVKDVLFPALVQVFEDIKNLASLPTSVDDAEAKIDKLTDEIGKVFDAVDLVMAAVIKLAERVPSKEVSELASRPVGIIHGVRRDFETAVEVIKSYEDKVDDVINKIKAAQAGFEAIRDQTFRLEWRPKLQELHLTADKFPIPLSFVPHSDQALALSVETRAKAKDGKPAGIDFSARLDRFDLRLGSNVEKDAPLTLKFKHLEVKQLATRKPDCDVVLDDLKFGGPLDFIQTLTDILPRDGFSDPPFLTIEADGIHAGFTLSIPDVGVGVFCLQNMAIKAEVVIPLIGRTPLKFAFNYCTKESPFLVTVAMLGGGGYFRMELDTSGHVLVEGSICIGAAVGINLGIASASVSITAGLFFSFGSDGSTIGGFLCLHGECEVLGLITISIDLRLELWWESATGDVVGRATLTVEVEIAFFSVTVSLEFEKRFGGASSSKSSVTHSTFALEAPTKGATLREAMRENPALPEQTRYEDWAWKEYVCAFA